MEEQALIGVIGGSGLYDMPELTDKRTLAIDTPFGTPSADLVIGSLGGQRVAFLPRHGIGHIHTPTTVPYRANIFALKTLGVKFIIGVNACGSLREDYAPGHIVIPDQLIDYTKEDRGRTFFETGLVGHISVADPFCPYLSALLYTAAFEVGATVHRGGGFIIIEGPRFSTRAESNIFRQWGCDIIGMTTCPEAFLAREAEIAYATMAHVTDYDVWHEEPVTVDKVIETMHHNITLAQQTIAAVVHQLDTEMVSISHNALANAIMSAPEHISADMRIRLAPIIGRYLSQ